MASKRMFDKAIIDTDRFCDMPLTTKGLYFLLGMEADDFGFVSPRRVMRNHGGSEDDLKILITKQFVIYFESGCVVITDWNKNNWLDNRRLKSTEYQKELQELAVVDGKYVLTANNTSLADAKQMLGENRTEEKSIEESSTEEKSIEEIKEKPVSEKEQIKSMIETYTQNPDLLKELCDFYEMRLGLKPKPTALAMKRILNELNKIANSDDEKIEILNNSIMNGWKSVYALKKSGNKQQNQRLTAQDVYNIPL